jgi:hypothetical protein
MDDFNAVAFYLIENQPILEILHRPAAKAASCRFTETALSAHSRHICQCRKGTEELIQEAFGDFQPGLFFQVFKLRIDFAPRERARRKMQHLLRNWFALRSAGAEGFSHLSNHLGSNVDRLSGVEDIE